MTALAAEKAGVVETWKYHTFTLTSGTKAWKGGACALVLATGKVKPGVSGLGQVMIGTFARTVDAAAGDTLVNVDLETEIQVRWFVNDGTAPVSATTGIMSNCYVLDDQTVTADASGRSVAGKVWAVDTTLGVAVECTRPAQSGALANLKLAVGTLAAFAAGDTAPAAITSGAIYDIPTTAANSTVSLPASPVDGTFAIFSADGTKNGHTITYRDVTTALTSAFTASKRHAVMAVALGGKWFILPALGTNVSP